MGSVVTFALKKNIVESLESAVADDQLILVCTKNDNINDVLSELEKRKEILEAVVLGSDFPEPVQMAQRIYSIDKTISTLVVASEKELVRVRQAFQFAIGVGEYIECVPEGNLELILTTVGTAVKRTRSRRQILRVIAQANSNLINTPSKSNTPQLQLDKISDYAPIGVALLDSRGTILGWNRKASELTALTEREVIGTTFTGCFGFESGDYFEKLMDDASHSSSSVAGRAVLNSKTGVKHFQLTLGCVNRGDVKMFMAVFQDITEQELSRKKVEESEKNLRLALLDLTAAKEEAERANQLKSTFLANMSHEIRTPIGAILGFVDLMKQPGTSQSDTVNFIATIDRNGHQLLRLIDDILDLSKIEAGKIQIQLSRVSLRELLADLNSMMGFRAREKGLLFKVKFVRPIPEFIESDLLRLRQILSNLLGNAIKFTEKGSIELVVDHSGDSLSFLVCDTGIGLDPDQIEKLFEPFSQADPSITRRFGGTGLGLALSKKLAEALNGTIRILRSQPGQGSSFELKIPAQILQNSESFSEDGLSTRDEKASLATQAARLTHMRILLVEDSQDNQVLVSRMLVAQGATVEFAENGLIGIKKATETIYDLVLMDMQMPVCGGLEATKNLRQKGYDKPIVALTAHAMDDERKKAFAAGCTDYLTKPINKEKLISVLERYRVK